MKKQAKYWAVIPAAGAGSRMQADRPKQYLTIQGEYVLSHTLKRLMRHPRISGVMVVISPEDVYWHTWQPDYPKLLGITAGGAERANSVLNGLQALLGYADENDWVLVHDAARPCLRTEDIDLLIDTVDDPESGGILALAMSDTVKQADSEQSIVQTLPRETLWCVQTPQLFGLRSLITALEQSLTDGHVVTDESSAIEHTGKSPKLVPGSSDNIKITVSRDLAMAEFIMQQQSQEDES